MIGRLNHVAIAVESVEKASAVYRDALGAKVSEPENLPEHGVTVVFVELPNTKIELLEPYGENSPIAGFVAKRFLAGEGIHYEPRWFKPWPGFFRAIPMGAKAVPRPGQGRRRKRGGARRTCSVGLE